MGNSPVTELVLNPSSPPPTRSSSRRVPCTEELLLNGQKVTRGNSLEVLYQGDWTRCTFDSEVDAGYKLSILSFDSRRGKKTTFSSVVPFK